MLLIEEQSQVSKTARIVINCLSLLLYFYLPHDYDKK